MCEINKKKNMDMTLFY